MRNGRIRCEENIKLNNAATFRTEDKSVYKFYMWTEKYDTLRKEIKELIEQTQLADVYLFEDTEAASISAGNHYIWELEECDICIFLIDNKDGIREGVQREIDTVANRQKKA